MKRLSIIIGTLLLSINAWCDTEIKQFELNNQVVYEIKVSPENRLTTVMFPSEIEDVKAANVGKNQSVDASFLISASEGSYYFTLQALEKNATGSINVIYNGKIYVLRLVTSKKSYSSVTFTNAKTNARGSRIKASVTPAVLVSLIDKAKAYHLYKAHHPEALAKVEYNAPKTVLSYENFAIEVNEIFRFGLQDTVVFHLLLRNKTDHVIKYDPKKVAVRCGDRIYYQSITDASGVIPPMAVSTMFFAITGTPDGGRNNLSPNNVWKVLLPTTKTDQRLNLLDPVEQSTVRVIRNSFVVKQNMLYAKAQALTGEIEAKQKSGTLSEAELKRIKAEYDSLIRELQINYNNFHDLRKRRDKRKDLSQRAVVIMKELEKDLSDDKLEELKNEYLQIKNELKELNDEENK